MLFKTDLNFTKFIKIALKFLLVLSYWDTLREGLEMESRWRGLECEGGSPTDFWSLSKLLCCVQLSY